MPSLRKPGCRRRRGVPSVARAAAPSTACSSRSTSVATTICAARAASRARRPRRATRHEVARCDRSEAAVERWLGTRRSRRAGAPLQRVRLAHRDALPSARRRRADHREPVSRAGADPRASRIRSAARSSATWSAFGYLFGPPLKTPEARGSGLVVRMGICIALAMNAMIFAIATYAGLHDGPTYALFQRWNLGLSFASVVDRRFGLLPLRVAGRCGAACCTSTCRSRSGSRSPSADSLYGYAAHRAGGVFIDTLDVFIALMLVGRFLQERVLENNRLALLANDGVDGLLARRERTDESRRCACTELRAGDRLVVAPGDLVPSTGPWPLQTERASRSTGSTARAARGTYAVRRARPGGRVPRWVARRDHRGARGLRPLPASRPAPHAARTRGRRRDERAVVEQPREVVRRSASSRRRRWASSAGCSRRTTSREASR